MTAIAKLRLSLAVLVALALAGSAKATPLLSLTVEGSTTGVAGTYRELLLTAPTPGSTLYFEVVADSALPGTPNNNTAKTPNGTSDSVVSLANFTLVTAGTFTSSTLQSNFNTGSGASAGTTGGSTLDIRAIAQGFTENSDAPLVIDSGTMTVGSNFGITGITANTDQPVNNGGSLRVAGSPVAQTEATEFGSGDSLVGYTPLNTIQALVPEPASLAIFGVAGAGLLIRRRTRHA